jgi:hypothetical protein
MMLMVMLYVGPDQLMPITSALAAIGGAIMLFWRQLVGFARRVVKSFKRG